MNYFCFRKFQYQYIQISCKNWNKSNMYTYKNNNLKFENKNYCEFLNSYIKILSNVFHDFKRYQGYPGKASACGPHTNKPPFSFICSVPLTHGRQLPCTKLMQYNSVTYIITGALGYHPGKVKQGKIMVSGTFIDIFESISHVQTLILNMF